MYTLYPSSWYFSKRACCFGLNAGFSQKLAIGDSEVTASEEASWQLHISPGLSGWIPRSKTTLNNAIHVQNFEGFIAVSC